MPHAIKTLHLHPFTLKIKVRWYILVVGKSSIESKIMPHRLLRNSTVKVSEMLQRAITELASMRKGILTVEFILLSLIEQKDSIVLKVMDELKLDTPSERRKITDRISEYLHSIPAISLGEGNAAAMKVAKEVQDLFERADRERSKLGDTYISTTSVFLACFDQNFKQTFQILTDSKLNYFDVYEAIRTIRGNTKVTQKDAESRATFLDEYTTDITALARKNQLDPVVGRSDEIQRLIEVLSRRKKNNPIIVGQPGVGKTVLVEGLAQQIVNGDVPDFLANKRILSLEMGTLIAGAKMQGEFEERLKAIKDEVVVASGDIIIFIDEIHTVIGAGRSGGGLDASNMLKPALAKGLLKCIGATTLKEYKQFIESDKALERRFQLIRVEEPSVDQAISILRGLQKKYQLHHQVEYTDDSIEKAVQLSSRYIDQRYLPDKAIDLLDEAGASKRIKIVYSPPNVRKLEADKNDLERKKLVAFNDSNFEAMAKAQMELALIDEELSKLRKELASNSQENELKVSGEEIASIVSRMTGIPVKKMIEGDAEKLGSLEEHLSKRVIGQSHAISAISNAIRRNRSGLRKPNKPIASFLFLGPTGVGKTELTKAIAEQVLDDENKIIRLDMSEYMQRHDVSKLIGSPPGYVGYKDGGQLTEKVKHQPYSVILLDEFEKAHPDVYNLLLPVLDEGWLTDGEGQKVSFRNCIIIGTSNLGSQYLTEQKRPVGIGSRDFDNNRDSQYNAVMQEVKNFLRPEFINRLDEIIIFERLNNEELKEILNIQVNDLAERLNALNLILKFSDPAKDFVLNSIKDLTYGARPIKRKMEVLVENKVASLIIEKNPQCGGVVSVEITDGELVVELEPALNC